MLQCRRVEANAYRMDCLYMKASIVGWSRSVAYSTEQTQFAWVNDGSSKNLWTNVLELKLCSVQYCLFKQLREERKVPTLSKFHKFSIDWILQCIVGCVKIIHCQKSWDQIILQMITDEIETNFSITAPWKEFRKLQRFLKKNTNWVLL